MIDPSDGQPFAAIASGNAAGYRSGGARRRGGARRHLGPRFAPAEKGRLLAKLAREILDHADELALIEARDCGKPLRQARADVAACARYFEFYGGASDKLAGETIPYPAGYTVLTWREPHGVTGHIIPVELSAADLRPLGRRRARRRQRVRREAGRGRVPVAVARRRAGGGGRLARRRAQHRHRSRSRGRRGARLASRHRARVVHRVARDRRLGRGGGRQAALSGHAGAGRQGAADRLRRRRSRPRAARDRQRHRAERRPDVLGRQSAAGRAVALRGGAGETRGALRGAQGRPGDGRSRLRAADSRDAVGARARLSRRRETRRAGAPSRKGRSWRTRPPAATTSSRTSCATCRPTPASPARKCSAPCSRRCRSKTRPTRSASPTPPTSGSSRASGRENGARQLRLARAIRSGQVFVNNYGAGGGVELPFGGVKHSGYGREKGFEALHGFTVLKTVVIQHG